jgi:hypothetical protein
MGSLHKYGENDIFVSDFIFVKKLEEDFNLFYKGRVTSYGKKGMFLCRDSRGFCWIEVFKNLNRFYKLEVNLMEDTFFVTARVHFRNPGEPFVLTKNKSVEFNGGEGNIIVSLDSGPCYVAYESSSKGIEIIPIHTNGYIKPQISLSFV